MTNCVPYSCAKEADGICQRIMVWLQEIKLKLGETSS